MHSTSVFSYKRTIAETENWVLAEAYDTYQENPELPWDDAVTKIVDQRQTGRQGPAKKRSKRL